MFKAGSSEPTTGKAIAMSSTTEVLPSTRLKFFLWRFGDLEVAALEADVKKSRSNEFFHKWWYLLTIQ